MQSAERLYQRSRKAIVLREDLLYQLNALLLCAPGQYSSSPSRRRPDHLLVTHVGNQREHTKQLISEVHILKMEFKII